MKRVKFLRDHAAYGHLKGQEASLATPVADMLVSRSYAEYVTVKKAKKEKVTKPKADTL